MTMAYFENLYSNKILDKNVDQKEIFSYLEHLLPLKQSTDLSRMRKSFQKYEPFLVSQMIPFYLQMLRHLTTHQT